MAVNETILERCVQTICAICESSKVDRFRIGYTLQPIHKRSAHYRGDKWNHIVAVADQMCREDALDLEKHLFLRMQSDKQGLLYFKYDQLIRHKAYRRSAGGKTEERKDEKIHSVYIAWADAVASPAILRKIARQKNGL